MEKTEETKLEIQLDSILESLLDVLEKHGWQFCQFDTTYGYITFEYNCQKTLCELKKEAKELFLPLFKDVKYHLTERYSSRITFDNDVKTEYQIRIMLEYPFYKYQRYLLEERTRYTAYML